MSVSMKKPITLIAVIVGLFSCALGEHQQESADDLVSFIQQRAHLLEQSSDMDELVVMAGNRRLVLLGEASHGTREYYAWRDSISRRLIAEHGFNFIAVEGDWASLYELNRYVKNKSGAAGSAREVLMGLQRWPLWMWGNEEVVALAEWLRDFNEDLPEDQKVGFYGKDVYDEWNSFGEVLAFLSGYDQELYEIVRGHYACFEPFEGDSWLYARSVAGGTARDCVLDFEAVVTLLREEQSRFEDIPDHEYFYLKQNALVVKHAERFYRYSMTRQDARAWNSRVRYMDMTVNNLLNFYGEDARGIVWAHNTHIGDARFTEMQQRRQENIGQLSRERHGPEEVFLVGFSTYTGTVKAGANWGDHMQKMKVPEARRNTIEYVFRQTDLDSFYLLFDDTDRIREDFMQPFGNRAIGVVYNPANDHRQYVQTIVPLRYDAILFFRETEALTPLIR